MYTEALKLNTYAALSAAYSQAMRRAWDMRFTAARRAEARQYLPQLTAALHAAAEKELTK